MPSTKGFVADLRSYRIRPRAKERRLSALPVSIVLLIVFVAVVQLLPSGKSDNSLDAGQSQSAMVGSTYQWRVYMLNQSTILPLGSGTAFSFRANDLPFNFASISFGDYRTDTAFRVTYYGGCGILVNASGGSSTVVLREKTGKFISSVPYAGQDLIVFSGERKSVSYPATSTSYFGTDKLIEDWRNGTWTPTDGILIEHPSNVTVTESVFCFMVFEPSGPVLVPEFGSLPFIIITIAGTVVLARRRSSRKCS